MFTSRPMLIIIFFMCMFLLRVVLHRLYDPQVHKGEYYTVRFPDDWEKIINENSVEFLADELDYITDLPVAKFTIYTKESKDALFLDDLFPQILGQFQSMQSGKVIDKGQFKVDGVVSRWLLYHNQTSDTITLSFFIVDKFNRLTQIEYSAKRIKFQQYQPIFEEFKSNFKFKRMF